MSPSSCYSFRRWTFKLEQKWNNSPVHEEIIRCVAVKSRSVIIRVLFFRANSSATIPFGWVLQEFPGLTSEAIIDAEARHSPLIFLYTVQIEHFCFTSSEWSKTLNEWRICANYLVHTNDALSENSEKSQSRTLNVQLSYQDPFKAPSNLSRDFID